MKKFLSVVLTVVMALSMACVAFAAGSDTVDVTSTSGDYVTAAVDVSEVQDATVAAALSGSGDVETIVDTIIAAGAAESNLYLLPLQAANKAVTGFFELTWTGEDKPDAYTPTLKVDLITNTESTIVSKVYAYHFSVKNQKLECVEADSFDPHNHTAKFTFGDLSPVAIVVVYEASNGNASAPGQTSNSTPASTSPAASTTITDASKAPNTGVADYTAVLCVIAAVAFGAAAVVTVRPRKRA